MTPPRQTAALTAATLPWSLPIQIQAIAGSVTSSAAVLAVNNHRDLEHDRHTGRRTFAARFGKAASARLFALALWTPFAITGVLAALEARRVSLVYVSTEDARIAAVARAARWASS